MTSIYADGVRNVSFSNGVVKIEFATQQQITDDQLETTPVATVALPAPGFLQTLGQLNKLVEGLIEKGVLQRNDAAELPKQ
jgi:hypothetical protein